MTKVKVAGELHFAPAAEPRGFARLGLLRRFVAWFRKLSPPEPESDCCTNCGGTDYFNGRGTCQVCKIM